MAKEACAGLGEGWRTGGRESEETASGSNGRGCIPAIFPLFVFHYFAEGSCPLLLRNTRGNDKGRSVAAHPVYNGKLCLPGSTNLFVQWRESQALRETLPLYTLSFPFPPSVDCSVRATRTLADFPRDRAESIKVPFYFFLARQAANRKNRVLSRWFVYEHSLSPSPSIGWD